jgi:predicted nucleic acid-binding protein
MIYWDTSAILPLYVQENSSDFWEAQLVESEGAGKSSALAITEFNYALHHKVLRGLLKAKAANELVAKFRRDCDAGMWELCPLGSDVIQSSLEIAKLSYSSTKNAAPIPLRTLDGLHLGAAHILKCETVATGDSRLAEAASRLDIDVRFSR